MNQCSSENKPVIVAAGTWSTNIGNALFQLGGKYIMSQVSKGRRVVLLTDQAGYWQYGKKEEPKYSARLLDHVDASYIVLHGSLLTYSFPKLWRESLRIYKERGIRVVLLGVGQFDYGEKETAVCRELLQEYPPYVFVSRDSVTFGNFRDLATHSYDGIDNAYFLPLVYPKIPLDYPEYIMLNFDKGPEPILEFVHDNSNYIPGKSGYSPCRVPFGSKILNIRFPTLKRVLSDRLDKYYGYIATLLGLKSTNQEKVDSYLLLRADHQTNPLYHRKLYYGPGAFAMDVPFGYLALYSNASLTLSDRIHACVVTMAYGGTAMLFSKSPRAHIIKQVGVTSIFQKPTALDMAVLDKKRNNELRFLRSVID
jgi:hypothetical protein